MPESKYDCIVIGSGPGGYVTAIVLCLVIIVGGGFLFWKLVRVMARIQVASRRPGEPVS